MSIFSQWWNYTQYDLQRSKTQTLDVQLKTDASGELIKTMSNKNLANHCVGNVASSKLKVIQRDTDLIRLSAPMSRGAHPTASELGSGGGADSAATPQCSGGVLSPPTHMAPLLQCGSSQHLERTLCNLKGKEVRLNSYIYFWPACTNLLWSPCPSYISWPKKKL